MASKCCGDNQMPDVLINKTIASAELIDTKIGTRTNGNDVFAGDCLVTCDDLAQGEGVSKDANNVVRPGKDGRAYVGLSTDPKNVTKLDNNGNLITPISSDANNIVKKGSDGGIYAGISSGGGITTDQNGNIKLAIKGCDGTVHAAGTLIPSCAQMTAAIGAAKQAAVNEATSQIPPQPDVLSIVRSALGSLISEDSGNIIRLGSDGKLYAAAPIGGGGGGVLGTYTIDVETTIGGFGGTSYSHSLLIADGTLQPSTAYKVRLDYDQKRTLSDAYESVVDLRRFTTNAAGGFRGEPYSVNAWTGDMLLNLPNYLPATNVVIQDSGTPVGSVTFQQTHSTRHGGAGSDTGGDS